MCYFLKYPNVKSMIKTIMDTIVMTCAKIRSPCILTTSPIKSPTKYPDDANRAISLVNHQTWFAALIATDSQIKIFTRIPTRIIKCKTLSCLTLNNISIIFASIKSLLSTNKTVMVTPKDNNRRNVK